jgi:hypothetical protein
VARLIHEQERAVFPLRFFSRTAKPAVW